MKHAPPEIGEQIARGGMGSVYRGTLAGREVAVKILDRDRAADRAYVHAFRTEIRAMASLCHPNLVAVFDLGRFADGPHAGCAYAVMELAASTLAASCGHLAWPEVRRALEGVLAGLAHAHARGITHRDLKPENLLLVDGAVKIGDFGLARAFEALAAGRHEQPAGTPGYMPDEQRQGRWRDVGPWTDLFALGMVALDLVARPEGGSVLVPEGFPAWVSRLRQPDPRERFRRAADALAGLRALGPARVELEDLAGLGLRVDTALALTQPYFQDQDALQHSLPAPAPVRRPPLPRDPPLPPVAPPTIDPSLGALRETLPDRLRPLATDLWAEAHRAAAGRVRLVVLDGGEDARRLARWLCHALHTTGGGEVEVATHAPGRPPRSGLAGMVTRELRCLGLDRADASSRLARWPRAADRDGLLGLVGLVAGWPDVTAPVGDDRFALVRRFVGDDAGDRLPLVWIDGAEHADEALAFAGWATQRPGPLLVVATFAGVSAWDPPSGAVLHRVDAVTDTDQACVARLTAALAALGDDGLLALGAAAVHGVEVEEKRWIDTARRASVCVDAGTLEALLDAGVAVPVDLGGSAWRLPAASVRVALLERLGAHGPRLHVAAAQSYPVEPRTALVRAYHLIAGGQVEPAKASLRAASGWLAMHDPHGARVAEGLLRQAE